MRHDSLSIVQAHSWRKLDRPELGVAGPISDLVGTGVNLDASVIEQLRCADRLLLFSDIGGDHRSASHRAHSFLLVEPASVDRWFHDWAPLRRRLLPDGRRISYERLGDRRRREAVGDFLRKSENLVGFLVTVLIEKKLQIFSSEEVSSEFAHWKRGSLERLLSAANLVSILLAGLSRAGQDVLWISDEDNLAPNDVRLREVCDVVCRISSHYLDHNLGHFRFATSKSDDGSRKIEDLLAFPDLAAGWMSELIGAYARAGTTLSENIALPPPESLPEKSKRLLSWVAAAPGMLKNVAVTVESNTPRSRFLVRRVRFSTAGF